jgi:hypothetical protein
MMQAKHENNFSDTLFYVFVDLKPGNEKPDYYIVPSADVATYIKKRHAKWLKEKGRGGKQHNDSSMRIFEIDDDEVAAQYFNKWNALKIE